VALLVAFGQPALTQDSTLIAEGDYAAKGASADKILAHWKLWHLSGGEYEAVESSAKNVATTQTFRFDAQFMPIGYSLKLGPLPKAVTDRNPNAATFYHPLSVSCAYKPQELRCESDYNGRLSVASLPTKAPYVFVPGEFYSLDFTWFLTGVVQLIERNDSQDSVVNVYVMTDSETNHNGIGLKADQPIRLIFTGEESALVMGKTQEVRKYEELGPSEVSVLRVTSQGLVALMSGKSTPTVGFGMSNYKEHVPWESPFHPVRHAVSSPEAPASSSQVAKGPGSAGRIKVSSGVMAGLLLRRVQPIYPESARQSQIQGAVVLSAVIGKDGHIIELNPVSGPAELTAAAITAVQQWEYRPYIFSGQPTEVETQIQVNFSLAR
jgi:TonB family protein